MGRYTGPKHKLSRREGVDLFGNGGESLQRRLDQPPGMHGQGATYRRQRRGDYDRQLREKQKVKRTYGLREKQFRRFYRLAQQSRGLTGSQLLTLLERRLDNVVFRMGWARTRPQARQFVSHGHVLVDGHTVDIPSYLVTPNQSLALKPRTQHIPEVQELIEAPTPLPEWLDREGAMGHVLRVPAREDIVEDIDEQLVVEFYSR
ncbi:MAG: 30S ribosomal protein S4 [Anaerolineae bacterium]|nr:30S ribosomal protein S4 [Anaerolineae bacterium]